MKLSKFFFLDFSSVAPGLVSVSGPRLSSPDFAVLLVEVPGSSPDSCRGRPIVDDESEILSDSYLNFRIFDEIRTS